MSNEYVPQSSYVIDTLETATIPSIDLAALTGLTKSFSALTTANISALNNMNCTNGLQNSYGNGTITSGSTTTNPHASPYVYTTNGTSTPFYTAAGTNWSTIGPNSGLHVKADAEFEGDIKWKGRSLGKLLEKIEDRLAILQEPDAERLEKFAALKKAYDHYKTLDRLVGNE